MPGPAPASQIRHVVVVGLMASGKTTVGRALATHLGWRFDDSDEAIEADVGTTVRELRDRHGEAALHEAEARHLLEALASPGDIVIAAAAGVVEDEPCRASLRAPGVLVVWLRASPAVLAARFANEPHRPLYGDDPVTFLAAQASLRDPRYASLDPVVVDIESRSRADVIEAVVGAVDARLGPEPTR